MQQATSRERCHHVSLPPSSTIFLRAWSVCHTVLRASCPWLRPHDDGEPAFHRWHDEQPRHGTSFRPEASASHTVLRANPMIPFGSCGVAEILVAADRGDSCLPIPLGQDEFPGVGGGEPQKPERTVSLGQYQNSLKDRNGHQSRRLRLTPACRFCTERRPLRLGGGTVTSDPKETYKVLGCMSCSCLEPDTQGWMRIG